MDKIEFSKLEKKEDMQLAFNQLKDDYHILFERHEKLKEVIEEVRYVVTNKDFRLDNQRVGYVKTYLIEEILDKVKEGDYNG